MTDREPPVDTERTSSAGAPSMAVIAAYVAALDIADAVDLDSTLQRIVDLARSVVPSRFAAIGVVDDDGSYVDAITSGISAHERQQIGGLPAGKGLLGHLVRYRTPLIVDSVAEDERAAGFPAHHPVMRNLLGVPITLGESVLGNLYLADREGDCHFDTDDLHAVQVLAAYAASAIDRARLYRESRASHLDAEEQRDQLRVILDSLPTAVLMVPRDPDLGIELNATGRRLLEMETGTPLQPGIDYWLELLDGQRLDMSLWPMTRALRGETVRNRQLLLCLANGSSKPVLVQAAPLRDAAGDVVRAVVVVQDITRLREAEQLKDDFLSLISHEFRTPLTSIQGGASLLVSRGDSIDPDTRRDLLEHIHTESMVLDQILTNVLTLTEIQAGRLDASLEPLLPNAIVRRALASVRLRDATHEYVSEIDDAAPYAEGDPELLAQVLRSLYENAAKYAPAGTTIRTTISNDATSVSIHIDDQGAGIAPQHIGSIFQRFRRPGADPGVRGMGLGLYLSKHLVEAQHGRIEASSAGQGMGSRFSVTLPRVVLDPEEVLPIRCADR